MEKNEQIFEGKVGNLCVEGITHKDFTLNYLKGLVIQKKDLPDKERLRAYIDHFVEIGKYDKDRRERIVFNKKEHVETLEGSMQELFEYLYTGIGVCQQFSQAMALVGALDESLKIYYCGCRIEAKGIPMGHAINVAVLGEKAFVVDVSALIHVKEGDYKTEAGNFAFVTLEDYIENLKKEDIKLVSANADNKERKNDQYLVAFKHLKKEDVDAYHYLINLPADDVNENFKDFLFNIWPVPLKEKTLGENGD